MFLRKNLLDFVIIVSWVDLFQYLRRDMIESLCENIENQEAKHIDLSENKFKKALNKVISENDDVRRGLFNKRSSI